MTQQRPAPKLNPEALALFAKIGINVKDIDWDAINKTFADFGKAMSRIAQEAARAVVPIIEGFKQVMDRVMGIPAPAPKHLSPFERLLTDLEIDRCHRINTLQDALLLVE